MKRPKIEIPQQKQKKQHKSKSSYEKYRCQYKQKAILTKFSSDSGYPQDILQARGNSLPSSNYLEMNKTNLKNFFKDRVPPENTAIDALMKLDKDMIHPKRIFQIKQLQYELKNKTKMNLKKQFEEHVNPKSGSTIDKLDANFHINDKTREVRQSFGGSRGISKFYETDNFRRGTKSHIEKRSKVLKKQAYDKVFGPDISSLSRTSYLPKKDSGQDSAGSPARAKSISLSSPFQQTSAHNHLRHLIGKMHDYKNKLQQTNDVLKMGSSNELNTSGEENMITLIQNMAKLYQERTVLQGIEKLENLDDIAKLNKNFYQQMLVHKNHRLSKRRQFALQTIPLSPQSPKKQLFQSFRTQRLHPDMHSEISDGDHGQSEEGLESNEFSKEYMLNAVKYRFKLLKKTLVRWAALFYIYGIKKQNIFAAFRTNRDPYHLEGSYAFFKCIKLGDLQSVKVFLENNYEFAFQIEFNGKSPLSYAAYYNQTDIAKLILEVGVNSDRECASGHTSLYYAITKGNVELVRQLLQKGACPWSTTKNPYNLLVDTCQNSQQISILLANARKVYLGMQIQPTITARKEYWKHNYTKIVQTSRMKYQMGGGRKGEEF